MHRGTKAIAVLDVTVLALLVAAAPAPAPLAVPGSTTLAAAAEPPRFRLAYTSGGTPTLAAAVPGGAASAVLPPNRRGGADYDPDARGDALVWISRRAPAGGVHLDGDIFFRAGPDAAIRRLTTDPAVERQPTLSPDRRLIAFTSDRGGSNDLWLVGVNGTGLRRLTRHPADDRWPTWSPDGTRLAFSSTRDDPAGEVYTMPVTGGPLTRVTDHPAADTEPAWSPDGRLAFTTTRFGRPAVATVSPDGGPVTREVPAPWDAAEAAWSPDGSRLAFVTRRSDPSGDVYVLAGGEVRRVARTRDAAERAPGWQGSRVLYTTLRSAGGSGESDVFSTDEVGDNRQNLTARPGVTEQAAAFSADGSRLAYAVDTGEGVTQVVVAEPDGRDPRALKTADHSSSNLTYADPTLSPDGALVAWRERDDRLGRDSVVVARATDGAEIGRLTPPAHLTGGDLQPAWSPRGDAIAVARDTSYREVRVEPETVQQRLPVGRSITVPTTVRPRGVADADDAEVVPEVDCGEGLAVTVDPAETDVPTGGSAVFQVTIRHSAPAPGQSPGRSPTGEPGGPGGEPDGPRAAEAAADPVLACTVAYARDDQPSVRQRIEVRPLAADQPYVQLDDLTVEAAARAGGAVADYPASAYDARGDALPLRCDHPDNARFPVGVTLVTCTATDAGGRMARDRAAVTVTDPGGGNRRIWVARIASLTADRITFGDQLDLGARLGAPCHLGTDAATPAWAPGGDALAFIETKPADGDADTEGGTGDAGAAPTATPTAAVPSAWLCVVDADGGNARTPIGAADRDDIYPTDPAWAPDGSRIAFTDGGDLRSVPAAGGALSTVVQTIGGAYQPAYQRLPDPDLHLFLSGGGTGYAGGDGVRMTVTVRNTSPRAATNVWVGLDLPAALRPPVAVGARCDALATRCEIGDLGIGDQAVIVVTVAATAPFSGTVPCRLTATFAGNDPATRRDTTYLRILQPALTVTPPVGRPGFVPQVEGVQFPPGATVRLIWQPGITAEPETVLVRPDGTVHAARLILREDLPGPRWLRAEPVRGPTFAPVFTPEPFLVKPKVLGPPVLEFGE